MEGLLGFLKVFAINDELHVDLPCRLDERLDVDVRGVEGVRGARQEARNAHVRSDDGDDRRVKRADLGVGERLAEKLQAFFKAWILLGDEDRDRVGVRRLGDVADTRVVHGLHERVVVTDFADHFRIHDFNGFDVFSAADHFDVRRGGDVVAGDERSGMVRIEGVFDADRNVHVFHLLGGFGVDGLHVEIGELVGDVEIGVADDLHFVFADDLRIGRAEMVFLMDDAFAGACDDGDLREGDFGIAAVETRHDAFVIFDIACDDWHGCGDVDTFEAAADRLVESHLLFFHPAGQIDENGVDAVFFQNQDGIVGGMRLPDGRKHFTRRKEIAVHVELAISAELLEVEEAVADAVEAFVDEFVRRVQIESEIREGAVEAEHFRADCF